MRNLAAVGVAGVMLSFLAWVAAQTKAPLPKVTSASVPFYPRFAPPARIQGVVTLRLSTDGKRVSTISDESGPPMLVQAAKENVRTWQFEPHRPTGFEVTFHYKLLPTKCDSECVCDSEEKESVLLELPTNVDVNAREYTICDPAEKISRKK